MLLRMFIFLIGFGLTIIGFIYIILYMNLMTIGYTFLEYVNFIIRRYECLYALFGLIIMTLVIFMGGKYEIRI